RSANNGNTDSTSHGGIASQDRFRLRISQCFIITGLLLWRKTAALRRDGLAPILGGAALLNAKENSKTQRWVMENQQSLSFACWKGSQHGRLSEIHSLVLARHSWLVSISGKNASEVNCNRCTPQ